MVRFNYISVLVIVMLVFFDFTVVLVSICAFRVVSFGIRYWCQPMEPKAQLLKQNVSAKNTLSNRFEVSLSPLALL